MIFVLDAHRYRSIDAGTGIPAAVRLQRIVHRNAQQILSRLNGIGNVHVKGGITVVVRADRKAVEIDSAILIDAFKMQDDGFPDRRFFQNKSLLILIFSAGEISGIDSVPTDSVTGFCQHGVVRQIRFHWYAVLFAKEPSFVQINGHGLRPFFKQFYTEIQR